MTLAELRARFRREVFDTALPYLFSDEDVNIWINEAQDEACRRALLLVDSKSSAARVSFAAGAIGFDLHPSVIFVRRAVLASTNIPLTPIVSRTMDEQVPGWEGSMASTPRAFIPDCQTNYLRLWPPSVAANSAYMTVVRTPLDPMGDSDEPEIRREYHAHLLDWAKFRAFSVPDSETYAPDKAAKHEAAFIKQFGEASAVNEHWALEQYYDIGAN